MSDSNAAASLQARRTFLPNSSSEPILEKPLRSKDSRFSFGETENANSPTPPSFNFLPPINFDDFQTSIASYESPRQARFPQSKSTPPVPQSIKASINSKPQPMTVTQREASVPNFPSVPNSSAPSNQLQTSASTSVLPVRRRGSQSGPGAPTSVPASGITARVTRKPITSQQQPEKKQQLNISRTPSLTKPTRKPVAGITQPGPSDTTFAAPTRSLGVARLRSSSVSRAATSMSRLLVDSFLISSFAAISSLSRVKAFRVLGLAGRGLFLVPKVRFMLPRMDHDVDLCPCCAGVEVG